MKRRSSVSQPLPTAAQRRVQRLIRELRVLDLEAGRSLVFEELRTLQIAPHKIDIMLRQVGQAKTTAALVECLESFLGIWRRMFSNFLGDVFRSEHPALIQTSLHDK